MQADGALVEFSRIHHAVYGIPRIDRTRMQDIHFDCIERLQPTTPASKVLVNEMKIFHLQTANRNCHPAVLIAMVVHGTRLTDLPANGHQFIERRAINQIACVMLPIPIQIWCKRIGINGHLLKKPPHRLGRYESGLWELSQFFNEALH